jgi:hypothetical protein
MQFGVNPVGAGILMVHLRRPLNLVISDTDGNVLQAGGRGIVQEAKEKETHRGNGRRLRKRLTHTPCP